MPTSKFVLTPEWAFRISLVIIYVWFGLLKPFGLSPASSLIESAIFWWDMSWFLPVLGIGEVIIGLTFLSKKLTKLSVLLVVLHMIGASLTPFFTTPESLISAPFIWTLEGQYVFKNLLILSAVYYLYKNE